LGDAGYPLARHGRDRPSPCEGHQLGRRHRSADGVPRVKLAIWSPFPPAASGIADYVAETLDLLARAHEIVLVCEQPEAVDPTRRARFAVRAAATPPAADLDVYHMGNSLAH